MTVDQLAVVWYRCHLCAPSVEWQDDAEAAALHLADRHPGADAGALLVAWMVTAHDPGFNDIPNDDEDASITLERLTWQ